MDDIKQALADLTFATLDYFRQRIRRRADLVRVATLRYRAPADWVPRAEHEARCDALSRDAAEWQRQAHELSRALADAQINPPKPAGYVDLSAMLNAPELGGLRAHMFAAGVRRGMGQTIKDAERLWGVLLTFEQDRQRHKASGDKSMTREPLRRSYKSLRRVVSEIVCESRGIPPRW